LSILAFDPSGNFHEGKGTTGMAIEDKDGIIFLGEIKASNYESAEDYWMEHINLIHDNYIDHLVVEGYRLYDHKGQKASAQANSILETPQLIGALRVSARIEEVPLIIQYASEVKTRWSEDILVRKGYLEKQGNRYYYAGHPTSQHQRDALKHLLHFKLKERKKNG
jgi:hypothetical protein